jgi:hypothetical protein
MLCLLAEGMVQVLPDYCKSSMLRPTKTRSRYRDLHVVLVIDILDTILGNDLDEHALEVNRETAFELLCTHAQDLKALLVVDVGVVVLV